MPQCTLWTRGPSVNVKNRNKENIYLFSYPPQYFFTHFWKVFPVNNPNFQCLELQNYPDNLHAISIFFFSFIFTSWRLIILQHCSGFCHTLTWISHGVTCIPHPDAPSHLDKHFEMSDVWEESERRRGQEECWAHRWKGKGKAGRIPMSDGYNWLHSFSSHKYCWVCYVLFNFFLSLTFYLCQSLVQVARGHP